MIYEKRYKKRIDQNSELTEKKQNFEPMYLKNYKDSERAVTIELVLFLILYLKK